MVLTLYQAGSFLLFLTLQATVERNLPRFQHILNNDIPPTISRGEVLKVIDTEGRRLIHIAAFYGALNILELLV